MSFPKADQVPKTPLAILAKNTTVSAGAAQMISGHDYRRFWWDLLHKTAKSSAHVPGHDGSNHGGRLSYTIASDLCASARASPPARRIPGITRRAIIPHTSAPRDSIT